MKIHRPLPNKYAIINNFDDLDMLLDKLSSNRKIANNLIDNVIVEAFINDEVSLFIRTEAMTYCLYFNDMKLDKLLPAWHQVGNVGDLLLKLKEQTANTDLDIGYILEDWIKKKKDIKEINEEYHWLYNSLMFIFEHVTARGISLNVTPPDFE